MVNSDFLPSEVRTKKYVIFILFSLWHMKRNSYSKIIVFLLIKRRPYTLNFTQAKKMHIIYIVFVHVVTRFILELSLTFFIFFIYIFCFLGHVSGQNYNRFPAPKLIGYLTSLSEWYKEEISLTDDPLAAKLVIFFLSF